MKMIIIVGHYNFVVVTDPHCAVHTLYVCVCVCVFQVLETFMALKIKEVNTEATDGKKKMQRKERFQKFSRRERKV